MRPLFYEFPDQPELFTKEEEYMVSNVKTCIKIITRFNVFDRLVLIVFNVVICSFQVGDSLLVKPVTDAGAVSANVLLPKGALWYNYFTGKPMEAGVQHTGKIIIQ